MLTIDKKQEWEDLEKRLKRTVDGIGTHLDSGILEAVVAMNATGIYTTASCEGHLDHGCSYPWVDIEHPEAEAVVRKILDLIHDGKREDEETKRLQQEVRMLHLQEEQKLLPLLDEFYQSHQMHYDSHLTICRFTKGEARLQSYGADYQEFRTESDQSEKLREYQQEMQDFTEFLKKRFFGESLGEEEFTVGDAADLIGMKAKTLTQNVQRGNLAAEKRGRDYFIKASELARFKSARRRGGRPSKESETKA